MGKKKILKAIFLGIALLLVISFVRNNRIRPTPQTIISEVKDSIKAIVPEDEKKLDGLFVFETPKGDPYDVYVTKDTVSLNEFNNIVNELGHIILSKEEYPILFQQGIANSSFISVKQLNLKSGQFKIEVSNNQPDHGSYSSTYSLVVDPVTKLIEENTHPNRDETLSKEDSDYLSKYPHISKLIGNSSLAKLKKSELTIDGRKLQIVVTVPITSAFEQRLYIFDNNAIYLEEKGFDIKVRVDDNVIEEWYSPEMIGVGDHDVLNVNQYKFDQEKKTLTKVRDANMWVLTREQLVVGNQTFEVLTSSGAYCASCHGQTLSIVNGDSIYLVYSGSDVLVKVVGNTIMIKSQESGGAPPPGTVGYVKVYAVDNKNKVLTKIKEYEEEYTSENYTGKW